MATLAADFVAAWKHVRDRFQRAGASNVSFLWRPIPATTGRRVWPRCTRGPTPWMSLDWTATTGVTVTTHMEDAGSRSSVPVWDELRKLDPVHPIVVTETASVEGPVSGTE